MKTKIYLFFGCFLYSFFDANGQDLPQIQCITPENAVQSRGISGFSTKIEQWKTQIIPYEFEPNLPLKTQTSFLEAIQLLQANTHLCFIPRRYESTGMIVRNFQSNYAFADLEENSINVGPGSPALMIHEIGHLLGLSHEHQRPDRDSFVNILWQNVDPKFEYAFTIFGENSDFRTQVYDYQSIMHYYSMSFSTNGQPTIELKHPSNKELGGEKLSSLDTAFLKKIYPKIVDCQRAADERPPINGFDLIPKNDACTFQLISVKNNAQFADTFDWTADFGHPATGENRLFSTYFTEPGTYRIWMKSANPFGYREWARDISIKNCADLTVLNLFPNPTSGTLNATLSEVFPPQFSVTILAENGQILTNFTQKRAFDGQNSFDFTLPTSLENGNYFLKIDFNTKSAVAPFVFAR